MLLLLFVGVWLVGELGIRYQIARIAQMAGRLSAGDLAARIEPPHPKGELGSLMTVLNDTAASLEKQRLDIDELNQKLRQSQKLEAVGQLTGGIAHDFNNLLTVIISSAELLDERWGRGGPDDRRFLRNILVAGQQGAELTKRLLAFARRQPLQPKVVNINEFVTNLKPLLARTIGEDVDIRINLGAGLWNAEADPSQVEAALLNLAINARDAMPEGGHLMIETANVEIDKGQAEEYGELQPGHYVSLSVTDDGCGMSPEVLARAIEPFFTTKGIGKGTGLGLPMVHGLAEQSGGRLSLSSRPGRGTRIEIWLPRADALGARQEAPPDAVAPDPANHRPLLVLAVDDDSLVLNNMTALIEDLGHHAIGVGSGAEALAALGEHAVDLVITDYAMPQMNGLQLADEISACRPELGVVLATVYSELPPGAGEGLPRLAKPYSQTDLARILHDCAPAPAADAA
jgi:signal transduction histidine kinase